MHETQVQSLDQEGPLEKEMATHSSALAWKILWTEEPGGLESIGWQRVGHSWAHMPAGRSQEQRRGIQFRWQGMRWDSPQWLCHVHPTLLSTRSGLSLSRNHAEEEAEPDSAQREWLSPEYQPRRNPIQHASHLFPISTENSGEHEPQ